MIQQLGLTQSSVVMAGLADGTEVVLDTFSCVLEWFGGQQPVEVVESDGLLPLLGVGLLRGHRLEIDFRLRTVTLE